MGLGPPSRSVPGMVAICEASPAGGQAWARVRQLAALRTWRPTSGISPVVRACGGGFLARPAAARKRKHPPPPSGVAVVVGPEEEIKVMMG